MARSSAYIYANLEGGLTSLGSVLNDAPMNPEYDYVPERVFDYYIINGCFLEYAYILKNAEKIKVKTYIIQGRYDMVCPPVTAYQLSQSIPDCQIVWTVAGHTDRSIVDAKKALLLMHH